MVLRDLKVNLACSMQKFKHEVTILVNNSCRAMHWCFACCSSGPRPSFPDLLCDAEAGILQTPPDSFDVCLLLDSLGQAQTGDWKAEGREKVFLSCSPYCGYHCPTSRFWCSQCQNRDMLSLFRDQHQACAEVGTPPEEWSSEDSFLFPWA